MGFGWLLMGYFSVNMIALYPPLSFMMLVGYALMIVGLFQLSPYHSRFLTCRSLSFLSLPFAAYYTAYGLSTVQLIPAAAFFASTAAKVIDWVYFGFALVFQLLLLWAIASLAGELGVVKQQANALRNMILLVVYHALCLLAQLPLSIIQSNVGLLSLPITLLRLLCIFLNIWLILQCYRSILPEGTDVTPRLPDLLGNRLKNKEK